MEQPGYRYLPTFSPTLSDSQLGELVKHTQRTLSLFEIAHQWVNDKATLAKVVKKDPAVAKEVAKFDRKNSFAQKLLKRHGEGTLSNWQMLFYLQEDIEWQRNFDEWETLKLQKLKKQNGQYLDQPLTLEDIRKETLDEIDGN